MAATQQLDIISLSPLPATQQLLSPQATPSEAPVAAAVVAEDDSPSLSSSISSKLAPNPPALLAAGKSFSKMKTFSHPSLVSPPPRALGPRNLPNNPIWVLLHYATPSSPTDPPPTLFAPVETCPQTLIPKRKRRETNDKNACVRQPKRL